jgi:tetratricopeptide (TPR) repeat protein
LGRGELTSAQQIADQMLEIAERTGDRADLTRAHLNQGFAHFARGALLGAERHFKASIAYYNEAEFSASFNDPRVAALCFLGGNSWHLGMADTARAHFHDATSLVEHLKRPGSLNFLLIIACGYYLSCREPGNVQRAAELLVTLTTEQQIPEYTAYASAYLGWAIAEQGRTNEGIALIRAGLDSLTILGNRSGLPQLFSAFGEELARAGHLEEALAAIEQALSAVGEQQIYLPGVLWQRGEVHQQLGDETKAADDFRETIAVAQRIGSKAFELRATTSLARLLAKQGNRYEARARLAAIYNWFTEGFETADPKDAKTLLDELGR